jgi:hypothetical protein
VVEMGEFFFHSFQRRESLRGDGKKKKNHPFRKRKKLEAKSTKE